MGLESEAETHSFAIMILQHGSSRICNSANKAKHLASFDITEKNMLQIPKIQALTLHFV